MNLRELIEHPELMSKETLYELRTLTAHYPYFQTARLLMLQNLFLLHDSSFDDELQRAAAYITDRTQLFNLVEAAHYQLKPSQDKKPAQQKLGHTLQVETNAPAIPANEQPRGKQRKRRKPNATDATIDYVAYLLEADETPQETNTPKMKGQSLIDKFIEDEGGKLQLQEKPDYATPLQDEGGKSGEEGYFTATLARIYVKQGRYSKALEIIQRLNLNYPKKSAYFADQIRFLEKLIINNKTKR